MPSEVGPIIFYDQQFGGVALPEGPDVSEEARLRTAAIGVYELQFRQQPHYEFSGVFVFHDDKRDAQRDEQQKQFAVSEDITETETKLTIQSHDSGINLESVEIVPLDWRGNPLEVTPLEGSETQRKISYRKDPPVESLKLKLSGLDVFDVEIINAVLSTSNRDYSPGKLAAVISRSEDIRIDRLDNSKGEPRKIEEHLLTLFRILLEKAPDRTFDFECNYRYPVVDGGANAFVPVLFRTSLNLTTAGELFSNLLPELRNWYQTSSPPEGVFAFGVKVFGAGSRESIPILQLTGPGVADRINRGVE